MSPYPRHVEQTMRAFYRSLRENDRRRYAAVEAAKLGHGGIAYIAQVLGIDPKTIRQGQRDLEELPERPAPRVRKTGGGRKRRLDHDPKIDDDFHKVLVDHTAGSPTEEALIWTNLTKTEIVDLMQECGSFVSVHIVDQLLDRYNSHERKALRREPLSRHPDRNTQFETIARLKRADLDSADPILSMDLKSRELLGNFFRSGTLLTRQTIRVFDHDFAEFAQGVVLPHGLYDLKQNRGYIHLGTSHETSEFACDCLKDWWERFGRAAYPEAKSILLLCDGGGSNPADTDQGQAHLFRTDVQRLVNALGLEIRVAHYPPYASKYNPIEHRLFPHLTRVCRGVIFHNIDVVAELMRKASTRTGLSVVVDLLDKVYALGRKVSQATKDAVKLVRDTVLPRWNYRILPNV
ncbi:MAG: ISAzo13 family transposase [Planctomycetaceae bacterium]|nr:ISAzo13 family transposase [Planctomycetaceae bacterium]